VFAPRPTEFATQIALRGYPARQWRKRIAEGAEAETGLAMLPRDTQQEIRGLERKFSCRAGKITIAHLAGGVITVAIIFE
jgi:hypothetical protein